MMFGIGTKDARLHANVFINLLGEDKNGWGLSHKGLLWHDGVGVRYTKRFKENKETKIGLLFDGINGTLTYYKDNRCLGVAFRGLNEVIQLFADHIPLNYYKIIFLSFSLNRFANLCFLLFAQRLQKPIWL